MANLDLTLLAPHELAIRSLLDEGTGAEAAAYIMFGVAEIDRDPWIGGLRRRFISHRFQAVDRAEHVSASATHITWKTPSFMRLLGDALQQGLMPAIVHTHPDGIAAFSGQDDKNERELARTAFVKGLPGLISLVIDGTGTIAIRIWRDDGTADPVSRIFHVGPRLRIVDSFAPSTGADELLDRQSRLFGGGFDSEVKDLRIGIAGGGATGSAVLTLLMHLGIGRLLVIDKDILELTNLNRVHGSRRSDAADRLTKTAVHARTVAEADLGPRLVTIDDWAGAPSTWDALKSCDVIFGCTDDHAGRLFLNRFAHFYGVPLIDTGLRMKRRPDQEFDLFGRVTTLVPGHPCLLCGGVIDVRRAAEEALERSDPEHFERLKEEAYVIAAGDPSPAVVTFTTEMASVAVNELVAALTGFHGREGMIPVRIRRFHARDDRFPGTKPKPHCPVCGTDRILGRGDVNPFLDIVE